MTSISRGSVRTNISSVTESSFRSTQCKASAFSRQEIISPVIPNDDNQKAVAQRCMRFTVSPYSTETRTQARRYSPRQVGSVCMGMEPWQLFILTEQVTWTNSGGMSSCGPWASSGESASRMLKESWSWLTVLESERDWSSPSVWELVPECSSYSTTRSVSLSVMMQQPDTFSAHMRLTLITLLHMMREISSHTLMHRGQWLPRRGPPAHQKWALRSETNCAFTGCSVWKRRFLCCIIPKITEGRTTHSPKPVHRLLTILRRWLSLWKEFLTEFPARLALLWVLWRQSTSQSEGAAFMWGGACHFKLILD